MEQQSGDSNGGQPDCPTFEEIFRFALETSDEPGKASDLQLAIIRASLGERIDCLSFGQMRRHFGVEELSLGTIPKLVVLVCGVRGGKSKMGACEGLSSALTADLSRLLDSETARFAIIGPDVDAATATFRDLVGIAENNPRLARWIDGEPTADTMVLNRPDGRKVEIKVVAAARGGRTVRNRWLCGFILEEVAQFGTEVTGAAVSAEAILKACKPRLLPGCQGWLISSPYGPQGLLYKLWKEHFGKPGQTLVVHADTISLNPMYPREVLATEYRDDPDNAAREYGAQWVDAETAFYDSSLIAAATRQRPVEALPRPRQQCWAAMDAGTRSNAWTLSVSAAEHVGAVIKVRVLAGWQWTGSKSEPLRPRVVLGEIAELLEPYGVRVIAADRWSFDSLQDHAEEHGLVLEETAIGQQGAAYAKLKILLATGDAELPPVEAIADDLKGVRKIATAGNIKVVLTKQANGRHCDFAPSVALSAHLAFENPSDVKHVGDEDVGLGDPLEWSRWGASEGRGFG